MLSGSRGRAAGVVAVAVDPVAADNRAAEALRGDGHTADRRIDKRKIQEIRAIWQAALYIGTDNM